MNPSKRSRDDKRATHRWTINGPTGTRFANGPWLVTGASADGDPSTAADLVFRFPEPGTYTVTHTYRCRRITPSAAEYGGLHPRRDWGDYSASVSVTVVAPLDADVVVSDLPDDPQHKRLHYTLPGQAERGWARLYTKEAADRPFVTRDLAAPDLTASYHQVQLADRLQGNVIGEECHGEIRVFLDNYERAATDETWQFTDDNNVPLPHGSEQLVIQGRNAKNSYTLKYLGATPQAAAGEDPATKPLTIELKADTDGSQAASDSAITPDGIVPDPGSGGAWPQQTVTLTLPEVTAGFSLYVHSGKKWGKMILRTGPGHLVKLDDPAAIEPGLKTRWTDKQKFAEVHIVCDIVADTNRDGNVDDSDEDGKDTFTSARGAVILNNADRDGGQKTPDNADKIINGPKDLPDLSRVVVRPTAMKSFPKGVRAVVRIPSAETNLIRVFLRQNQAAGVLGSSQVLGKDLPGGSATEYVLPEATMTKGSGYSLYAEALQFIGVGGFAGQLKIQHAFQRQMPDGTWPDLCSDEVQLQVAPVVFAWNGQPADRLYASREIAGAIRQALPSIAVERGPADFDWFQDYVEIGNTGGASRIPVLVDLVQADFLDVPPSENWPLVVVAGDPAYAYVKEANSGNGGDFEVTPPTEMYPLGLAMVGSAGGAAQFRAFVRAQNVQVKPDPDPAKRGFLSIDTLWLDVGHVDEMFSFVPGEDYGEPFSLLMASPREAVNLLHAQIVAGNGRATIRTAYRDAADKAIMKDVAIEDLIIKPSAAGLSRTTTKVPLSPNGSNIQVTEAVFVGGDLLRMDDEYMLVTQVSETAEVSVLRVNLPETLHSQPTGHGAGTLVYAVSDLVKANLGAFSTPGAAPQCQLDGAVAEILQALSPDTPDGVHVVELPVLFFRPPGTSWQAYTANLVNCLVTQAGIVMPDTQGPLTVVPGIGKANYFHEAVQSRLRGRAVTFIDAWSLHRQLGNVHCGSNCRRAPLAGTCWWVGWNDYSP